MSAGKAVFREADGERGRVLAVDLDGTLIRTDLLFETAILFLRENPFRVFLLFAWLLAGKAQLKQRLAESVTLNYGSLPYREELIEFLQKERAAGTRLVLATAADGRLAEGVAAHLGIFDEVLASDGKVNLSSTRKLARLVERFGEGAFGYAGNDTVDICIWDRSKDVLICGASGGLLAKVKRKHPHAQVFGGRKSLLKTLAKALRLHQWVKNVLVFLPIFTAHRLLDPQTMLAGLGTFFAFGLCASSVYLLNDMSDLEADRLHRTKRNRPIAAGDLPIPLAMALFPALLASGLTLAAFLSLDLLFLLASYLAVNLAYTFHIKRVVLLDVLSLAGLYTLRIFAGAAGTGIEISPWLLGFSMFFFLSLALVKRASELQGIEEQDGKIKGRGYFRADLDLVRSLGTSSGYLAVLILALYVSSDGVVGLYEKPELLWLLCPLVLFWISRVWLLVHRGEMHDDPVVFALRDKTSYVVGALAFGAVLLAT